MTPEKASSQTWLPSPCLFLCLLDRTTVDYMYFFVTVNTKLPAIFTVQRQQRNWNMDVIILVLDLQNISAGKENVS